MKVILRDPPLPVLLVAIVLELSVHRTPERRTPGKRGKLGWWWRQLDRLIDWRNSIARRA